MSFNGKRRLKAVGFILQSQTSECLLRDDFFFFCFIYVLYDLLNMGTETAVRATTLILSTIPFWWLFCRWETPFGWTPLMNNTFRADLFRVESKQFYTQLMHCDILAYFYLVKTIKSKIFSENQLRYKNNMEPKNCIWYKGKL